MLYYDEICGCQGDGDLVVVTSTDGIRTLCHERCELARPFPSRPDHNNMLQCYMCSEGSYTSPCYGCVERARQQHALTERMLGGW